MTILSGHEDCGREALILPSDFELEWTIKNSFQAFIIEVPRHTPSVPVQKVWTSAFTPDHITINVEFNRPYLAVRNSLNGDLVITGNIDCEGSGETLDNLPVGDEVEHLE